MPVIRVFGSSLVSAIARRRPGSGNSMLRVRIGWKRRAGKKKPVRRTGWTDARPGSETGRRHSRADGGAERGRSVRLRVVMLLLGTVFVAGSAAALLAERGFMDLYRSKAELARQKELLRIQVEQVRSLRRQIDSLRHSPAATEKIAREQLGMVRNGEIVFLLPWDEDEFPAQEGRSGKTGRNKADNVE